MFSLSLHVHVSITIKQQPLEFSAIHVVSRVSAHTSTFSKCMGAIPAANDVV